MKAKQIEKLLTGVMNNLIDSVTDKGPGGVADILEHCAYITGGCIPSMLMDEYVNDYDIYLDSKLHADKVQKYYEKLNPTESDLKKKKVFLPKLITENSINLTDKVQIIIKYFGNPKEVIELFDWQHIKSYFTLQDGLIIKDDVYKLIVEKELIYTGSNYPLSSLLRTRKFLKKGWTISTKTMVHIVMDILGAFNASEQQLSVDNDMSRFVTETRSFDYKNNNQEISIDTLIHQLNGVDPINIQAELEKQTGKHLTLKQVLELL
jgi:hypothetical protein